MSSVLEIPTQIAMALTLAANMTGADYDYLVKTAARESSFKAAAQSRTSSATGLFQFIEETWLRTLKEDGPALGLGDVAAKITKSRSGRYFVASPRERRDILNLRNDPRISALMAGAYTKRNAEALSEGIGRAPTSGELYLAHFLGPRDAIRMIELLNSAPRMRADHAFPAAAKANRSIFFDDRRPRTVREVYRRLVATYDGTAGSARSYKGWRTLTVRPVGPSANRSGAAKTTASGKDATTQPGKALRIRVPDVLAARRKSKTDGLRGTKRSTAAPKEVAQAATAKLRPVSGSLAQALAASGDLLRGALAPSTRDASRAATGETAVAFGLSFRAGMD